MRESHSPPLPNQNLYPPGYRNLFSRRRHLIRGLRWQVYLRRCQEIRSIWSVNPLLRLRRGISISLIVWIIVGVGCPRERRLGPCWNRRRCRVTIRRDRGSMVNIASQLGIVARRAARKLQTQSYLWRILLTIHILAAYCASKSAVIGMTCADAIDDSQYIICVNAICPGLIETPTTADSNGAGLEVMKPDIAVAPMNRMGKVAGIAGCALFLASSRTSELCARKCDGCWRRVYR